LITYEVVNMSIDYSLNSKEKKYYNILRCCDCHKVFKTYLKWGNEGATWAWCYACHIRKIEGGGFRGFNLNTNFLERYYGLNKKKTIEKIRCILVTWNL